MLDMSSFAVSCWLPYYVEPMEAELAACEGLRLMLHWSPASIMVETGDMSVLLWKIYRVQNGASHAMAAIGRADLLQSAINDASRASLLRLPLPTSDSNYPVFQYADDTIAVLPACTSQARVLRDILVDYATSVGPKINFHKSTLVPINLDHVQAVEIAAIFGCSIGEMPFTYLGLPMGTTRLSVTDLMPLVISIQRRVPAAALLLDYGSKLTVLNSVVTSLAIYAMCSIKINPKIIEHLDKLHRSCLWVRKSDDGYKGNSLAAWGMVCRPKSKGGLGIIDLKILNQGLLRKQLHKFYTKCDVPWGAADVPCTLLHFVNDELVNVAKGKIVQPGNPVFHGKPMPPTMYRVQLVRVLPGCDELLPPIRPAGADGDDLMTLSACISWPLLWPKSQIRSGAGETTPKKTPPVVPVPSHDKTAATLPDMPDIPMAQDPNMHMAQDLDDDDNDDGRTFSNVDKYFAKHGYDDEFCGPLSQEPNPTKDDRGLAGTVEKPNCNRRRLAFSSQETPPAADFTEPQIAEEPSISAPTHSRRRSSLHDSVFSLEKRRLRENDVAYPVFVAKVPEGKGFVDGPIGGTIVLRFDDIFAMFNLHPLHYTFVRLFSLSMEMRIIRDKTPDIVIVDPFYMRAKNLCSTGDRHVTSSYLEGVILANPDKDNFLVPYFPDDTHCTLILLSPIYSMATYLDPDRDSRIDYTNIKKVLDDVLPGYAKSGGTFAKPVRRRVRFPESTTTGRSVGDRFTVSAVTVTKVPPRHAHTHPPDVDRQEMAAAAAEMAVREETSVAGNETPRPWQCCDMARCTRSSPPICTCQDKVKSCAKTCKDCHKDESDASRYVCGDQYFGWPGPNCTKV
nr:putative reverse transcriptase [Triticum aestivum]BDI54625.1 putative reverse transcriptase [Triticum aestivum]